MEQMALLLSAALTETDVTAFVSRELAKPSIVIKDVAFPWREQQRGGGGGGHGRGLIWLSSDPVPSPGL